MTEKSIAIAVVLLVVVGACCSDAVASGVLAVIRRITEGMLG